MNPGNKGTEARAQPATAPAPLAQCVPIEIFLLFFCFKQISHLTEIPAQPGGLWELLRSTPEGDLCADVVCIAKHLRSSHSTVLDLKGSGMPRERQEKRGGWDPGAPAEYGASHPEAQV